MKAIIFTVGFLILLITEIARVYFIMPFPGSQQANTIDIAYFIQSHLGYIRLIGILLIAWPMLQFFKTGSKATKLTVGSLLIVYLVIFYLFNFKFLAEKMFYQPTSTVLLSPATNKIGLRQLVIGVTINGQSKAYPIQLIGYHHQVRDVVGGEPVMVTYCTVCRTGRVFSPKVDGKLETFRLVGMDHFNAMFEDKDTRSWWRQVNGEAIAGLLKGKALTELPSEQMSLQAWIAHHPQTLVMQPDPAFAKEYDDMKSYEDGKSKSSLTLHDTLSWKDKSWVVGVTSGISSKAYDWNDLVRDKVIDDQIDGQPIAVLIENDTASFHCWKRVVDSDTVVFAYDNARKILVDEKTGSSWDWSGHCYEGKLNGKQVTLLPSYQEYWHSWKTFHPSTTQYTKESKNLVTRR